MLIGNKVDLEDQREVSYMEATEFAENNGMKYIETSAAKGSNIQNAFNQLIEQLVTKTEKHSEKSTPGLKIGVQPYYLTEERNYCCN